ncbi:MAG: cytochrome c biosis protein transrane region, partial [bacterium]|nr:cytochrome c biosis protein transrane region [bacterium]
MDGSNLLAHGYVCAFVTGFVGGFLTSLTPCVYPLIPITVSLFGARGEDVPRS